MKYRKFGRLGWDVSEIGYGGWGIGKTWWGQVNDDESSQSLELAWDMGVRFFDTAYVYGDGHSEKIMARALARRTPRIATKIPPQNQAWPPEPGMLIKDVFPSTWIRRCTERSLKNLKTDSLDLQQFHVWIDEWVENDEWKETISKLKQEGKIQGFGVSVNDHQPDSVLKLVQSGLIDSVQVIFNIYEQAPLVNLLPLCQQHNVAVIVRVPLDEGGLSGTLTPQTKFERGDFRRQYFQGDNLLQAVDRADKLKAFIGKDTPSLPALALKFVLAHEAVSTVIVGMRKQRHVKLNCAVSDAPPLDLEVLKALRQHAWKKNFYGWWD